MGSGQEQRVTWDRDAGPWGQANIVMFLSSRGIKSLNLGLEERVGLGSCRHLWLLPLDSDHKSIYMRQWSRSRERAHATTTCCLDQKAEPIRSAGLTRPAGCSKGNN